MENSLGEPQVIVLLGGTSDIGLAIVRELLSPATRAIVLCCRDVGAGQRVARVVDADELAPVEPHRPGRHRPGVAGAVEGLLEGHRLAPVTGGVGVGDVLGGQPDARRLPRALAGAFLRVPAGVLR